MPHLIADRFLALGSRWIDLATGTPVRLRVSEAGSRLEQAIWNDGCDTLARLRHPLLNPLIDYGALDGTRVFEAYVVQPPVTCAGAAADRLLTHVTRFLETHGVYLTRAVAAFAMRAVAEPPAREPRAPRPVAGRPIGIVLQARRVLEHLNEMLDGHSDHGAMQVDVCGGDGSGLRTLQVLTARAARVRGFAPLCASALGACPWIADGLLERHACILTSGSATRRERAGLARLWARMGVASARSHAAVTFNRTEDRRAGALSADPLGVTAMTTMVYLEDEFEAGALFKAAREADGRPGVFLRRLNAAAVDAAVTRSTFVHETAPAYIAQSPPTVSPLAPARPPRSARVASNACAQAERLVARGRHGAAARLLARAFRVLHGRGESAAAARAALQLGWLRRERGDAAGALQHFERARTVHPHEVTSVDATVASAVCWTDEGRLREAEAAARAAVTAADALNDRSRYAGAAVVLARVLFWMRRLEEAAVVLEQVLANDTLETAWAARALEARVKIADGDASGALNAAREAVRLANVTGHPRAVAVAHRAAATASAGVGDLVAARSAVGQGLDAARRARAPLQALRLRAVLVAALQRCEPASAETARLAAALRRATERRLPALVRWHILATCDAMALDAAAANPLRRFVRDTGARALLQPLPAAEDRGLADLQRLLELCHAAPDDRHALERVCDDLRQRLQAATVMIVGKAPEHRRLAAAGRAWPGEPRVALNVLDTGLSIAKHAAGIPPESAEPVRYGGDIIAAVCCRWTAGTIVHAGRAAALLRLAALAGGPSVRSMLDRSPSMGAEQICPELLGTSAAAQALRAAIARAARAPFPVLVEGESGTGKELVARAIHRAGPRRDRKFCPVNCAAIGDDLLEAELFGHARGAFTGAVTERAGLFEEADGGTLFLDEVGELSARAQAKLLRVLQEGEVRRIGENFPRRVDARVVAATNRTLADEASAGRFRSDLRYRLDVVRIDVPPLRDRPGDIPLLAERFWSDATARVGSSASLAPDAISALSRYDWPGNVRELQNVIASMSLHAPRRGRVTAALVPAHVARVAAPAMTSFDAARDEFERRFVRAALARAAGHPGRAAQSIGISRQGLAKMMKRLGIRGAEGC